MKLHEYVDKQIAKHGGSRSDVLEKLAAEAQVSIMTLKPVDRGAVMGLYQKAKAVSAATGGEVTIADLCEQ